MSKRRADKQLTDRDRPSEDEEDEMPQEAPQSGNWQASGTASEATMANRKIIKAVRRGPKPAENDESTSNGSSNSIEIVKPSEEKKEVKGELPKTPFSFITTPVVEKKEEKKEGTEEKKEPAKTPFSFAPSASKSPFTFNFGSDNQSVKWPSFQPTPLPTFSPPNLPSFNLGGTPLAGGKDFQIAWPTFPAANFNFDVKKSEATEKPNITSPPVVSQSPIKMDNLESTADLGKNATQTKAGRESFGTPGKTFGENIDAPHSPVVPSNPESRAVESSTPLAIPEKQENIVTGEEEEEIVCKARVKLLQFEGNAWNNKGIGLAKLMKHKETAKTRLVMRVEGSGTVLLNVPLLPHMEVSYHQQKNLKFVGVNAKGEPPFKAGTFSMCFSVATEKDEMYKQLNNAIANAEHPKTAASTDSKETKEEKKEETKEEKKEETKEETKENNEDKKEENK